MATTLAALFHIQRGDKSKRVVNYVLQITVGTIFVEGVRQRDPSVIVNGVVGLIFAVLPRSLEDRYGVRFHPWQRLWVSAAALIHTLGMLGPYDRIWWWDHLAHTLSSVVVAGATDVVFQAETREVNQAPGSPQSRSAVIAGVTLVFGLFWEVLEYLIHTIANWQGFKPLLVHYGRCDAIGDIIFDLLGAGLVILFGRQTLSNVSRSLTDEGSS